MKIEILKPTDAEFKRDADFIKANVKELCKGLVTRTYIAKRQVSEKTGTRERSALDRADALLLAYEERETRHGKRVLVAGFAILNHEPYDGIYIDVICAKGHGKQMMEKIEEYARKEGKKFIHLSALPHVINYYRKQGFVHSRDQSCVEPKPVTTQAKKVEKLRFPKQKVKGDRYTEAETAVRDQKFRKLLSLLISKGFAKDNSCRGPGLIPIKHKGEYHNGCSVDGYIMRKCLK